MTGLGRRTLLAGGAALLANTLLPTFLLAQEAVVAEFQPQADGRPAGWTPLTFRNISRHTRYAIVQEDGRPILRAESEGAASGLIRRVDLDPRTYRHLSWQWKIENTIAKGDERSKEGDDYAARIYVAFRYEPETAGAWERARYRAARLLYGEYPPKHVLNYIWANCLPKGEAIDNAFTNRAKMIAVRSGSAEAGQWLEEERNVYADYRRLFGQEPPRIAGIAVMTDTDNTGERAVAYYDRIVVRRGP